MRRFLTVEWFAVLAGICLVTILLFTHPFIGVADNGDFLRVMGTSGLNYGVPGESYEDRFFGYAHQYFAYDQFFRGFYTSTQMILVIVARKIGYVIHPSSFDIRVLGALYAVLLLSATYIIVRYNQYKSTIVGIVLALCLLFVFYDIGYIAYFNSLFGEPVSLVFLLLSVGFGLCLLHQKEPSQKMFWLYFIGVFFLTFSKIQNAPVGIMFALLGFRFTMLRQDKTWRRLTVWLSVSMIVLSVGNYIVAPKELKDINLYQTVFFGILKDSPNIEQDLQELGLPEHLLSLAGTNYFQSDTVIIQDAPSMKQDFYDRVSHMDVVLFYMKHPNRLIEKMKYAANNSMSIRPYYLGNYLKQEHKPSGALTISYSCWSEFKNSYVPRSLLFITLFYLIYYAIAMFEYIRHRDRTIRIRIELMMLIGLLGFMGFLTPIIGDGQADIGKHLFLFNVCVDMMLVVSLTWIVYQLVNFKKSDLG
ncbi:glycan biosynthesis hexose transferase WsfD [Paenibacillus segetis]|uniref:Membrane protein n=1 Tax=Paenibacillus segetis TaxID=1325360 RepID=A0ABQ1YBL7_9BACL|nr:hypothetical protein [Paenibacillus segetis]GGH19872.1 membrane protein [Paenibacillus segetis]